MGVVVMICDVCGVELEVGSWPYCPHGRSTLSVVPDDVPGGFWAVNGFTEPVRFYSHSAHEQALAARGLEVRAKNAGPDDKICPRWDTVDLEGAKALLERGPQRRREQKDPPIPITVREVTGPGVTQKDVR